MIENKKIIYAEDLAKEIMKHPRDFIVVDKVGESFGLEEQQIIGLTRRDGNTTVLNIENFKENGFLKYYR